jgi:hypothetical protein
MKMRLLATIAIAVVALLGLSAASASAAFEIEAFDGQALDEAGNSASQATSHPASATAWIEVGSRFTEPLLEVPFPEDQMRKLVVELPPGLVGNPTVVSQCTRQQLLLGANNGGSCPLDTQVGLMRIHAVVGYVWAPLYEMEPPAGTPAAFGFNFDGTPVMVTASVRTGSDYGVNLEARNISQAAPILGAAATLWGVPGAPVNDSFRYGVEGSGQHVVLKSCLDTGPISEVPLSLGSNCHVDRTPQALVTNPSACTPLGVGLKTTLHGEGWSGATDEASFVSHEAPFFPAEPQDRGAPIGSTGCDEVPFSPSARVRPESSAAGAPTGLSFELSLPQGGLTDPAGLATSDLKNVKVALPQGMTVNPSSADGLSGCSPNQVGLTSAPGATPVTFTPAAANCPESAKLGTVQIKTPLLENTLKGGVYLASQGSNPFNSLLALYVAVADPQTGVVVKLPGKVSPDPATGQLTATFDENPQLPFETLNLQLKGGARAALVTPSACGTYVTHTELTPWARPTEPVSVDNSFSIDQNCGVSSRFTPGLEAGSADPTAGKSAPFTLRVTRPDGQQNIASIEATLPKGLLANLKGVPLCGDAEAASGNCPDATQVGTASVGAGAGSSPIYVPQPGKAPTGVYLAGPYRGAPYSLVVKVPAQAGPFDLGTVAVRNALYVNPETAQVTAKSDPLPQILQGIPIAYRDIRVDVNRSDFTLNPTSCDSMSVTATIASAQGATATPSSRFQAASCASLGFAPKLTLKVKGKTRRGAYQRLTATLTQPQGQANIGNVSVALPHSEFLAQEHIRTICTRVQFNADQCPQGSIYGYARAFTPLLDQPLQGPVYLRANGGERKLPDLVAALHGQIDIDLAGYIDSVNGGIRTSFKTVPDAPVSKFVLEMKGGAKSLLINSTNLCKGANKATVKMDGQNGKTHDFNPALKTSCGRKRK